LLQCSFALLFIQTTLPRVETFFDGLAELLLVLLQAADECSSNCAMAACPCSQVLTLMAITKDEKRIKT